MRFFRNRRIWVGIVRYSRTWALPRRYPLFRSQNSRFYPPAKTLVSRPALACDSSGTDRYRSGTLTAPKCESSRVDTCLCALTIAVPPFRRKFRFSTLPWIRFLWDGQILVGDVHRPKIWVFPQLWLFFSWVKCDKVVNFIPKIVMISLRTTHSILTAAPSL